MIRNNVNIRFGNGLLVKITKFEFVVEKADKK